MVPYLIVFLLASLIASIDAKLCRKGYKYLAIVFACFAVLVPAILAGARNLTIGTDTMGYIRKLWELAETNGNPYSALAKTSYHDSSPLYTTMVAFVSKRTNDIHWMLLAASLLQLAPAYAAIRMIAKGKGSGLSYAYFLLMHFNEALNMNRQAIAMGFVLLAIAWALESRYVFTAIAFVLAYGFHNTSILAVPLTVLVLLSRKSASWALERNKTGQSFGDSKVSALLLRFAINVAPVLAVFAFMPLISFLIDSGFIDARYRGYLDDAGAAHTARMLFYSVVAITIFMSRKSVRNGGFYFISSIYALCLRTLSYSSGYLWRVGVYYHLPTTLFMAQAGSGDADNKSAERSILSPQFVRLILIVLALAIWYFEIVKHGRHATYPYRSELLGI